MCALCDQVPETASHICLQCCYAKEIWLLVSNWVGSGANLLTGVDGDIHEWWNRLLAPLNANQRRLVAAILMDTTWNIWKERNRRIFDNTTLRPDQVFELIQNDVLTGRRASGTPLLGEELLVSQVFMFSFRSSSDREQASIM
uniref:Reverse transcriptase zinc-binding domain-containing protein n=1 Tax=Setaria viridis TaxID=4556 RepID=A0A4V6DAL2_SETVI|nr:hypothetical protein SEVIR_2G041000v2 [Setaria viridis]